MNAISHQTQELDLSLLLAEIDANNAVSEVEMSFVSGGCAGLVIG